MFLPLPPQKREKKERRPVACLGNSCGESSLGNFALSCPGHQELARAGAAILQRTQAPRKKCASFHAPVLLSRCRDSRFFFRVYVYLRCSRLLPCTRRVLFRDSVFLWEALSLCFSLNADIALLHITNGWRLSVQRKCNMFECFCCQIYVVRLNIE